MILTVPMRQVGLADEYVDRTVIYPIRALASWAPNRGATMFVTIGTERGDETRTHGADETVEIVAAGLR